MKTAEDWRRWAEEEFFDSLIDSDAVGRMIFDAVAGEREACAALVLKMGRGCGAAENSGGVVSCCCESCQQGDYHVMAEAIRARGQVGGSESAGAGEP